MYFGNLHTFLTFYTNFENLNQLTYIILNFDLFSAQNFNFKLLSI
jgi:hypothetical protein